MILFLSLRALRLLPPEPAHALTLLALRLRVVDAAMAVDRALNICWFVPLVYGCLVIAGAKLAWRRVAAVKAVSAVLAEWFRKGKR
jgi:hypothetical protein